MLFDQTVTGRPAGQKHPIGSVLRPAELLLAIMHLPASPATLEKALDGLVAMEMEPADVKAAIDSLPDIFDNLSDPQARQSRLWKPRNALSASPAGQPSLQAGLEGKALQFLLDANAIVPAAKVIGKLSSDELQEKVLQAVSGVQVKGDSIAAHEAALHLARSLGDISPALQRQAWQQCKTSVLHLEQPLTDELQDALSGIRFNTIRSLASALPQVADLNLYNEIGRFVLKELARTVDRKETGLLLETLALSQSSIFSTSGWRNLTTRPRRCR